ncbi:Aste57867_690 [Aphanomyces stellatus]|uniref:Aste57867_690 protein n=1 Tax=Aphanomyces stellatus TaxID=120398 RepID=A0A485K8A2_9STRA|nr:hypothetical protein As57867_000689 [Aphanomyces stellatus]VFT77915.1 Aste57867_690 [Aphanomyces stellatus]
MMKQGSVKDFASAFEHERQALVKDLETMRLQLVRKEEQHKRSNAISSSQLIGLKKEIADLVSQRALVEKESDLYQQKCKDLTTLLEASYDQHEEDQTKLLKLTENLKRVKKKYDDGLDLAKKEATISIMNTHEERKSLKANAERLRCKLNAERKEWIDTKQVLTEQMEDLMARNACLERELKEAKHSDKSHRLCQDQMLAELRSVKHDLVAATHDHALAKVAIDKYKGEICRVVEETRLQRDSDMTLVERLHMAQEDAVMGWRSRTTLFHENCTLKQHLFAAQQKYDALVAKRKQEKAAAHMLSEELSDVRRDTKRMSIAFEAESAEQTQRLRRSHHEAMTHAQEKHAAELLQTQVESERRQSKIEASNRVMLEEIKQQHKEEVHAAREIVEKQMQTAVDQVQALCESTQHKLLGVTKEKELADHQVRDLQDELETWRDKERKLIHIMEHSQKLNTTLEERHLALECKHLDAQKQIEELMGSVKSLQSTIANQRDLIDELERSRQAKADELFRELAGFETEKLESMREIAQLQEQHSQDVLSLEIVKRNQELTIKQITQAQLSANRLIEEQAKTIEDLLETRMAEPSDGTNAAYGPCPRAHCQAVANELVELHEQRNDCSLDSDLHQLLHQTSHQVGVLEREKEKLLRVIDDQALTIHELTLQDEQSERPELDKLGGGGGGGGDDDGWLHDDDAAILDIQVRRPPP